MFNLILSAAGNLGNPGMVIIDPQTTTKNSAPLDNLISLTDNVWSDGAPLSFGSVEKLYCVFAIQTGNLPNPAFSIFFICYFLFFFSFRFLFDCFFV